MRIGVNTGEAVTGAAPAGGSFTAGDMVNVAARLEQSARPGDVLLGHDTYRLVRHAVDAEPVAPLTVKGKGEALDAFRLLAVAADAHGRPQRPRAPMVGRRHERAQLLDAFDRAVAGRSCELFTVLGAAGVGKSRLVAEVVDTLHGAATVAAGRCLPYGDGLTWWPLVDALGAGGLFDAGGGRCPGGRDARRRAAEARGRAGRARGGLLGAAHGARGARPPPAARARRRRPAVGRADVHGPPRACGRLGARRAAAAAGHGASGAARRPAAVGRREPNASSVLLEPLADAEAADLLGHLLGAARLGDRAAARILDVAEGNPLFVEEVVAMLIDDGVLAPDDGRATAEPTAIAVPPTIQALLAARLDRLEPRERAVIEAASIEGKEFARERVRALVGDAANRSTRS